MEEKYRALMEERNSLVAKQDDMMKKVMEAKMSQGLEKEQMGERFTLIDAARLPERPIKPNIPAILLIGAFLGIGAGVGTASLWEFSDRSIRTLEDLGDVTGLPVLGGIPMIIDDEERTKKARRRWVLYASILVILGGGVLAFHFLIMDLDIFWLKLMHKLRI